MCTSFTPKIPEGEGFDCLLEILISWENDFCGIFGLEVLDQKASSSWNILASSQLGLFTQMSSRTMPCRTVS